MIAAGWFFAPARQLKAQPFPTDAQTFLTRNWRLSPEDLQELQRGAPVGKLLKSDADGEVAFLGAIRLNRPKEHFVKWYRKVDNFKYSPLITEVTEVGNPPVPSSVDRLVLDLNELRLIRKCIPGNCGVKLLPTEIQEFRKTVDWSAPDATDRANLLARRMVLEYAGQYIRRGTLATYNDKGSRVELETVFRSLLNSSSWLSEQFPDIFRRLSEYAGSPSSAEDDFFYWSRERYGFGLKSILNLYHVTIGRPSRHVCVIASKQIRSSHYYDGSLGLMVLFDAEPPAGDQQSSYLVYVNRSRVDLLRGSGLWSWKRLLFERYLSGEIRKQLTLIKNAVDK